MPYTIQLNTVLLFQNSQLQYNNKQ